MKLATFESVCEDPYLPFDPTDSTHAQIPQSCSDPEDHGAAVLGYIANTNPDDPEDSPPSPVLHGFSHNAELFSANASYRADSFGWLVTNEVALANFSFYDAVNPTVCPHVQSVTSVLSDYYATHYPYVLSVAGAGNYGHMDAYPCASDKVFNVLLNGLVVGAAWPHQVYDCNPICGYHYAESTDRTLDWSRQTSNGDLWVWLNPDPGAIYLTNGDLELPPIVAYNRMRRSLNAACEAAGTSFSTPQVTGAAALVSQENPSLYGRPEALRAVLLAGADVNTDLNTPGLGSSYSYDPLYNTSLATNGVDRHGGMGLLNTLASVQISAVSERIPQDNRYGLDFSYALANVSQDIQTYQSTLNGSINEGQLAPVQGGHNYGVMDPDEDFFGIWYKHFYYFTAPQSGYLRIVLAWNRPYDCTFDNNTTSCGPDLKPDLNMLLRDLDYPTGGVAVAASYDPTQEFMAAPVVAGKTYRLDIYEQNYWPGSMSFGLGAYFTINAQ